MPVYLVHGFRWPREGFTGIRVHAVVHNLDDLSVEYIQNGHSRRELLRSLRKAHPDIMKELDQSDIDNDVYVQPGLGGGSKPGERRLEFIEQYNPEDVEGPHAVSQPYAYVGDKVVVIAATPGSSAAATTGEKPGTAGSLSPTLGQRQTRAPTQPMQKAQPFNTATDVTALSVNLEEVIANGPGLTNKAWEALADLRDSIAEGEKIGWWVVFNGDPDRGYDESSDEYDDEDAEMDDEQDDELQDVEAGEDRRGDMSSMSSPISPATAYRLHRPTKSDNAPIPTSSMGTYPISTPAATQPQQVTVRQNYQTQSPPEQYRPPPQPPGAFTGLTALPVRPPPPSIPIQPQTQPSTQGPPRSSHSRTATSGSASASDSKGAGSKQKDVPDDPSKLKEVAKSQGLRKKFFGRRT